MSETEHDWWTVALEQANAERDVATERAKKAEAALAEMRGWYAEDTATLQRILEAHDEDEAHDWIPDNLSRTVSEMRKSLGDRLFRREDAAPERAADEQGVQPARDATPNDPSLSKWHARLLDAIRREGGDWNPSRARDALSCAGYGCAHWLAGDFMRYLAERGYLERVRPGARTYRLKGDGKSNVHA